MVTLSRIYTLLRGSLSKCNLERFSDLLVGGCSDKCNLRFFVPGEFLLAASVPSSDFTLACFFNFNLLLNGVLVVLLQFVKRVSLTHASVVACTQFSVVLR